jgi:predicted DCC family thiol-disulfide oxidoreductase YuxK
VCTELTDIDDAIPPRGWVLYDADCSFCTDLLARVKADLVAGGFQPEPLQTPWVRERLNLPEQTLLAEMRVLTREGQVLGGADALVFIAKELRSLRRPWWAWLLVIAGKMSFSMPILRAAYRWIAARRRCVGDICPFAR